MADQLALVTGASSGIGLSLAHELASRGYDLIVCSAGERLDHAYESLQSCGVDVAEIRADLATREGVEMLWETVKGTGRPLDIACINAGVGVGGNFWDTDLSQELNMVELNCAGTIHLAKHVVREMKYRDEGRFFSPLPLPVRWSLRARLSTRLRRPSSSHLPTACATSCVKQVSP